MSEDIGPGDKVIALIDASDDDNRTIRAGSIYEIAEVAQTPKDYGCNHCGWRPWTSPSHFGFRLAGEDYTTASHFGHWCHAAFRKAGRGGMFDQLLVVDPETTKSPVLTPNPA